MRTTIISGVLVAALAVTGCNRHEVSETNATVEEVANAVVASGLDTKMQPGRWEATVKLDDINAPDMPPQMLQRMKAGMGEMPTIAVCLTEKDVERPDAVMAGMGRSDCRYDHFNMSDGKYDAKLSCPSPMTGGSATATITGTFSANETATKIVTDTSSKDKVVMHMVMSGTSKRVGECRGDEQKIAGMGDAK